MKHQDDCRDTIRYKSLMCTEKLSVVSLARMTKNKNI